MELSYINEGRGGHIIYKDNQGEIQFSFEFGGGDCVVIIFVPKPQYWESRTGRPIAERNNILDFVANQCVKDQVKNGRFEISDDYIELFSK